MKNLGLRTQLLFLALLPALVIAVILAAYMVYRVSADTEREWEAYGNSLARQLAAVSEFAAYSGDLGALRNIALAALDETRISSVAIYDSDGILVASSGAPPAPKQRTLLSGDENSLPVAAPIVSRREGRFSDRRTPWLADPAIQAKAGSGPVTTLGWVTLQILRNPLQQRKRESLFFVLLSTFAVLAFSGLLALLLGRQVIRPILRLQDAVARMQAGHLEALVPISSGGDLRRLEDGLNSMAEALRENRELLQMRIAAATHELEEKKSEVERSSIAKSRFLAAASHDLRQPLHALSLFAVDLGREAHTPAQQRLSRQINESVNGIAGLLDALLDISRLDLVEVTPQKSVLPLSEIFAPLEARFSRLARDKGLRFRCRPTGLGTIVDAVLFERLLGNLVTNAIAYTPTGSVLVAARRRGNKVRVEVRDSGIGIALENCDAVFQEFFQVGNAGRVQDQGLGLAIVSRLARILGLGVDLRSLPGKGSVFSVTLPLVTLPRRRSESRRAPSRLALLLPQTPPLAEVADLATRWGMDVIWVKSLAELRGAAWVSPEGERTVLVESLERFEASTFDDPLAKTVSLVLLGNPGKARLGSAHVLSLPLRPAKLRALLGELFSATG